nr:VanZ family protein [Shewanella surugensis]
MSTKPFIFKIALVVSFILISYLVFSQPNFNPSWIPYFDKLAHFGSFFLLSYLAYFAFKPNHYTLVSILGFYAMAIEVVQSLLPYRSASFADLLADFVGMLCFYLSHLIYLQLTQKMNEISSKH